MDLITIRAVAKEVRAYTSLDTSMFEDIAGEYLKYKKLKTFNLKTQIALKTLIEMRADVASLGAYLLFHLSRQDRMEIRIDKNMAHLLSRLDSLKNITTLGSIQKGQSSESVRKMFLSMSKDMRVVLVLMAIRYSDLFDLGRFSEDLRKNIARQTLDIFVPIAGRLGIYKMKRLLEDYCFCYLLPMEYKALEAVFDKNVDISEETVSSLVDTLEDFIKASGIEAEVSGRVKGKYSTYLKLKRRGGGALDEIPDLLALRAVAEKQTDCYTILGLVNNHWQAIAGRFKDYIAMPKVNGYRSLHTTVLGMMKDSLRPVEIQIRTVDMHQEAEYGIAAHWWYEEEVIKQKHRETQFVGRDNYQEKLQWVKNLINLKDIVQDDFGQKPIDFFSDSIFVMTLAGMVIELPKGSTPLDFAYAVSESLGNHCSKAKVNGEVVSLDYELKNGDKIFVVKKMEASPNLYWLSLVQTEKAKMAIRKWMLEQGEDTVLDQGVRMLNRSLRLFNHKILDDEYSLLSSHEGEFLTVKERRDLLIKVGQGETDADELVRTIISAEGLVERQEISYGALAVQEKGKIYIAGETGFDTKTANCCSPHVGMEIVGYVTRGGFISVHAKNCKVLDSLDAQRRIEAWWGGKKDVPIEVRYKVLVNDANMLAKLSLFLRKRQIVMNNFTFGREDGVTALFFDLQVKKPSECHALEDAWRGIEGVSDVKQIKAAGKI